MIDTTRKLWIDDLVGRALPRPVPGAFGSPSTSPDGLLQLAVRAGYHLDVAEVRPGMYVVALRPKLERPGAQPLIGADANLWTGIAQFASGLVTDLGDWVAGWFPKAQQARAEGQRLAQEEFLSVEDTLDKNEFRASKRDLKLAQLRCEMLGDCPPRDEGVVIGGVRMRRLRSSTLAGHDCECGGTCGGC